MISRVHWRHDAAMAWRIFTGTLAALMAAPLTAGSAESSSLAAAVSTDVAAVEAICRTFGELLSAGDLAKLRPLLADEVTAVMVTSEGVRGADRVEEFWTRFRSPLGSMGSYALRFQSNRVEVVGDTAVIGAIASERAQGADGRELRYDSAWTFVCRRDVGGGGWKILRIHASMNPMNNVFLERQVRSLRIAFLAGGVFIGVVLMILVRVAQRIRR